MDNDLKHLEYLQKVASSLNLFESNPVLFKVAVNDYRYYKAKFAAKHKQQPNIIENGLGGQVFWKQIQHPYDGKTKIGFKGKFIEHWENIPWLTIKNQTYKIINHDKTNKNRCSID